MTYRSNRPAAEDAIRRGLDEGLRAAAENYTTRVYNRILGGYTTGNFSHRAEGVAGRVMFTEPRDAPGGGRQVICGTSRTQVPYELYWELGHQNAYSRRYERVEIWRPLLEQNRELYFEIIGRNVRRRADGAGVTVTFGGSV